MAGVPGMGLRPLVSSVPMESLDQAIQSYRRSRDVTHVEAPERDQRVIVLLRNNSGYYIPALATVQRVNTRTVTVLLYVTGTETTRVDRRSVWRDSAPAPAWCATKHTDPYPTAWCCGSRQRWIGTVFVDRLGYSREYSEVDYKDGTLSPEQVFNDWHQNRASFQKDQA